MAECYLCGTYIPRGQGYRRRVQTGTSQRIYVGRWTGGSAGVSQGTRTVCHTCARIMDEQHEGGVLRSFLFIGLCAILAFLGFKAIMAEHAFFGLAILVTGPVVWGVSESIRNKSIAEKVVAEVFTPEGAAHSKPFAPPPPKPSTEKSLDHGLEDLRECFLTGDFQAHSSAIKDDESLSDWCHRTAVSFPATTGISTDEVYRLLISAVQFNKPRPRIPVADWFDATQKRIKEITANIIAIDLSSPESGRQKGETNTAWLSRVGPLFLTVRDGESKDDAIETLVEIAAKAPPLDDESVKSWFERVKPYIEEHNSRLI